METVLKNAIKESGRSYWDIAKEAGIARSILSLFMTGRRTMTLPVADRICKVLELELRQLGRKARQ